MASSSRSRRAVVCTTVPAGRASSGAPAHWAPCRSRGRGGHAAPRAPAGSGFRAPGAVIDDPAAQQHPGTGGGGPSIRSPRAPGARAHQVTGPLLASGCGARTTGDIVVARQAGQQDRVPAIGLDPLAARAPRLGGRRHLAGDPAPRPGPWQARNRSDRPHSVALTSPCPARRPATSAMTSPASLGIVLSISPHPSACRSPRP